MGAGAITLARREVFTNSLAAGEIAPEFLSRTDMSARQEAAKTLTNVQVLAGGGIRRRPGTRDLVGLAGDARLEAIGIDSSAQIIVFLAGGVRFLNLDSSLVQAITGAPWIVTDLHTMQVAIEDDHIVVTSQNFPPQVLTLAGAVWSLAAFTFSSDLNGGLLQPYYRFPGYTGVAIQPSAYSGAVTIASSAPLFTAAHVGSRFRYTGIEMLVTAYTSPTLVSATVQGKLYPTITTTVADTSIFIPGQEVSGLDSSIKGVVVSITSGTKVVIQLTGGYTFFNWTSSTVSEKIVSPTGVTPQTTLNSVDTGSPAATLQWDEQLLSAARGYPGSCGLHRQRLLYGNFPAPAKNVICASAIGDITDYDVGTGLDTDAIVELIDRDAGIGVRHFGSTEQLLFFTQSGSRYVPEQVGAPLSPTNFDLLKIGPESAALPVPLLVSEGMLFVEERSGRVLGAIPTGNVRRSWQIADLSELAFHLCGNPVEIELLAAQSGSDRKVFLVRDDGVLAVMAYRRSANMSAWMTWRTLGQWRSVVSANGSLYMVAMRTINGVATYRLEVLDSTIYGDGIVSIPTLATTVPQYANQTVSVWDGTSYLGDFPMDGTGALVGVSDTHTAVQVGFDSQVTAELVPPIDGTDGLRHKLRIVRVEAESINSGPFTVNGFDPSGYTNSVGVGGALVLKSGTRRFRTLGRSRTQTALIFQAHAGPLEIRSVTMEVTS